MLKLYLIEGQPAIGRGIRLLLDAETDIRVIGEAPDCARGLVALPALHPDVVLIDLDCPHAEGLTNSEALAQISNYAPIVLLTLRDNARIDRMADCLGATVVVKSAPAHALLDAIRRVSWPA